MGKGESNKGKEKVRGNRESKVVRREESREREGKEA